MPKYAVLRNLAATRTASPFESVGPTISAATLPEPQVDIVKADLKDIDEIVKDPQVQGLAPVMPISLMRPVEIAANAAAPGDAWRNGAET